MNRATDKLVNYIGNLTPAEFLPDNTDGNTLGSFAKFRELASLDEYDYAEPILEMHDGRMKVELFDLTDKELSIGHITYQCPKDLDIPSLDGYVSKYLGRL